MLTQPDGMQRAGWALRDARGVILLGDVCESEREARELRRQQRIHQPHRGELQVVPVLVAMTEAKACPTTARDT